MLIPVRDAKVQLSRLGKDDNVLINQATGEVQGTHITTYKQVDSEQFVKLFTANIAMTFDLTSAGIKTFNVLMFAVQTNAMAKDEVMLDVFVLDDFLEIEEQKGKNLALSITTFKRGLNELEKAKIIAKTIRQGRYFINPGFAFNGDRIAFTKVIENTGKAPKKIDEDQTDMFD